MYPSRFKRMKFDPEIMDFSDPFAIARYIDELNEERYGSITKEYEEIHALRMKFINLLPPYLIKPCSKSEPQPLQTSLTANGQPSGLFQKVDLTQHGRISSAGDVIDVDSDSDADGVNPTFTQSYQYEKQFYTPVVVRQPPSIQYEKVSFGEKVDVQVNKSPKSELLTFKGSDDLASLLSKMKKEKKMKTDKKEGKEKKEKKERKVKKEKILHASTSPPIPLLSNEEHSPQMLQQSQDDVEATESDGLEDLWNDMSLAIECSKDVEPSAPVEKEEVEKEEECCHSFILKDDLGIVCRVCGVVQRSIETIFDFQWTKNTRDARHYVSGTRKHEDMDEAVDASHPKYSEEDAAIDLGIDPRHKKLMKPHQIEGFRFLVKNLMVEKPGGCILAHAPGSGKTFMLISFMQSFITQKPDKRPLVVLPKGILSTWKREFQQWQLEDIPLFDFYSSKADHRPQQLEILKSWEQSRGILFLGYKQFTNIVSSTSTEKIDALCREKLLMVPGLLILDEGHTPRNNNTAIVHSLSRIKTPRKVVLSGTLFQNHVKEVFNILKLVRPKFMKEESSRNVMKRILSSVEISAGRRPNKGCKESAFCDLVHETLQNDDNSLRKNSVIKDLREMTHSVLHYYKGDFLDELPGMVDFTVFLKLTSKQKSIASRLHKLDIFKGNSVGSAVYMHPNLKEVAESVDGDKTESLSNDKVDGLIGSLNVRDGVKTKFFLGVLSLSESAGEKLLVFSQYILPLKFLERLVIQRKGWRLGKEVFMISGDSNPEDREWSMEQFNNSADARVLFGSIKACGEGISLVGASRILILDVHLNPSVTRQAIGRAFRPGQRKKVYTYRLVAADSPEEEHHNTSFKKELISKLWFECNEYSGQQEIDLHEVELTDCDDIFLESPALIEDIKCLYKR
ncbi:protein CHROMATIN REMODELING 35 [Dendrobium catenatum]|uniref:DNA repair and recombination protein RAD54 n=1 Tax=Dendrobium catenatum TaxID=906689 RepID=A0A2I0VV51_9ASPA|nr:protein CHROMATIN REMODELING 35 [Dendrobium catenatum]XP_028555599.1 protein CHROMATIN REMODELING 35 [Dendrobium catenatum]PKU67286.1 DNA repair and recombination protein RAD54 [Dendrobium catenatum]